MADVERMVVPEFLSEGEESAWWDSDQKMIAEGFRQAAAAVGLGGGRVAGLRLGGGTSGASPSLTIRVPETDIRDGPEREERTEGFSRGLAA